MKKLKRVMTTEDTPARPNGNGMAGPSSSTPQNGHLPVPPPFYEQVVNAKLEALSKRMETTQRLEVMGHNLGDVQASMTRAHQQQQELYQNLKSELSQLEQSVHSSEQLEAKIEQLVALQSLLIRIVVSLGVVLLIAVIIALVMAHRASGAPRAAISHAASPPPVKPAAWVAPATVVVKPLAAVHPAPAAPVKTTLLKTDKSITHASHTQAAPAGSPAGGTVRSHPPRNARPALYRRAAFHHGRRRYRRSQARYRVY